MEIEIKNFRCWKKHKVQFIEKGIILISGESGSGKSSILNSIFFGITGIGVKILTYGEKKCFVKMKFEKGKISEIYRSKNPCRLIVTLRENDNKIEDDEAQGYINSVYGKNFQQTSYMNQKMIHSFLSLSPSEKISFLQKFVLDDSFIQEMKKKCKEKISELKRFIMERKSKITVLQGEIDIIEPEILNKRDIEYSNEILNYSPELLKNTREKFEEINTISNIYFKNNVKKDELDNRKNLFECKLNELLIQKISLECKIKNTEYKGDEYYEYIKKQIEKLKKQKELNKIKDKLSNEENNLKLFIEEQINFYENEKNKNIDELKQIEFVLSSIDTETQSIISNIDLWNQQSNFIISFLSFQKTSYENNLSEINIDELNRDISFLENEIETMKITVDQKQQKIMDLKQELKLRNKIHNCPKCNILISIENEKLKIYNSEPINIEEYQQLNYCFQNEINLLILKLDSNKKKLFELQTKKKDFELFLNKNEKFCKQINEIDIRLLNYIDFDKKSISNIQMKMSELQKQIDSYKRMKNDFKEFDKKITDLTCKFTNNINIIQKNRIITQLKNDIKLYQLTSNIDENEIINEDDLDNIFLYQNKEKQEYLFLDKKIKDTIEEINDISNRIISVNSEIEPLQDFLDKNQNVEIDLDCIKKQINKYVEIEDKYNGYLIIEKLYEQKKRLSNDINVHTYLCNMFSGDIVIQEMFLNKINESESISITKCIDSVNFYINDYLEKFFKNDSIIVNIVPFKETKKDIKSGVTINICYKGEIVELTSLSGGEYDRVSLAIMLAFNHICKSDMIILDESICSLDSELTNDILEILKENLTNKRIIIVAHQIGTGLFDQIINVKSI